MESNLSALTRDGEGLPIFTEIEPNAVQQNLKKSRHLCSYILTTFIWLLIIFLILCLMSIVDINGFGHYFGVSYTLWISGSVLIFCYMLNCIEFCYSSTFKYLKNKFDSADQLVDFIS